MMQTKSIYIEKMKAIEGVKYTKDATGRNRYLRIDLDKYGGTRLIEDFLDALEVIASKGEETVSLDEFNRHIDERLSKNV
jgi:hypothetical protein